MGNNASSPQRRRSSLAKDTVKTRAYSVNHIEYSDASDPNGNRIPIRIKLKTEPTIIKDSHNYSISTPPIEGTTTNLINNDHSGNGLTKNPFIPGSENNNRHKTKPLTPSIFINNFIDNDYFGLTTHGVSPSTEIKPLNSNNSEEFESRKDRIRTELDNEVTNVLNNTDIYDYEDEFGIDDDLISPDSTTTNNETILKKKVLIKYQKDDYKGSSSFKKTDLVYVVGSFNHWNEKVQLEPEMDSNDNVLYFKTLITLPYGVYRIKFIVNNEIKYSDKIPIATDKFSNVVNWFEVEGIPDEIYEAGVNETRILNHKLKSSKSFLHEEFSNNDNSTRNSNIPTPTNEKFATSSSINLLPDKPKLEYSQEIPLIFQTSFNKDDDLLPPVDDDFIIKNPIPDLPVYLNNNYLNKHFNTHHHDNTEGNKFHNQPQVHGLNSHIMPHVNLNHLLTSNMKNEVLGVACTTRYVGKFMTKIMYSPSEYEL